MICLDRTRLSDSPTLICNADTRLAWMDFQEVSICWARTCSSSYSISCSVASRRLTQRRQCWWLPCRCSICRLLHCSIVTWESLESLPLLQKSLAIHNKFGHIASKVEQLCAMIFYIFSRMDHFREFTDVWIVVCWAKTNQTIFYGAGKENKSGDSKQIDLQSAQMCLL